VGETSDRVRRVVSTDPSATCRKVVSHAHRRTGGASCCPASRLDFGGSHWESPPLLPWQPRPRPWWRTSAAVVSILWSSRRSNRRRILAGPGWLLSVKRLTRLPRSVRYRVSRAGERTDGAQDHSPAGELANT
jgi:hypothetical protein